LTASVPRPLLFLDVDGPLIPFGPRPVGCPQRDADGTTAEGNPLLTRLSPGDGPRLLALQCDLAWATTWGADANAVIAPRLGLPELPVVQWLDADEVDPRLHWKTRSLVAWATGRPFVWLDDEITPADRAWVDANHPADALLHRVEPSCGLTTADYAAISEWQRSLG
jgi:hypothetical protein